MQLFEKTLGDFLEYWAEKTPDKEFIVYSYRDLRFTYSEFNKRVNNLAKGMMAIGVEKDSKVGIWATNVPDWLTFLFASAKIGAILVTVNTNYKQHELEYLVEEMAKNVHEVWSKTRIEQGWTYGEKRDDVLKQHPCLVPYEELPEEEKVYDRNSSVETLKLIMKLGFKISKDEK